MGIRRNILTNEAAKDDFLRGIVLLDQEQPGISTADLAQFLQTNQPSLRIRGINQQVSTYDLFVFWHLFAMRVSAPPGNAAHSGPIFLPWHRMYLIRLEEQLQRVLNDPDFGLPYWDWADDGELGQVAQRETNLWSPNYLGESRGQVVSGLVGQVRVRLAQVQANTLGSINPRPIERNAGRDVRTLPRKNHVSQALNEAVYDQDPWSMSDLNLSHRNRLEGWVNGPSLHNRVHVWVGGDMGPGTSPNDPVFFLNHCNVDRIWEAWMANQGRIYAPLSGQGPRGHRIDDVMVSVLGGTQRPQDVLDPSPWYSYDSLQVD